uniref:Uncharacterized protein n=1 Tax=Mucochytrium quahogii TaxID=96639 RepID=A0A7S2SLG2_9STRA|mmetsp:Transcript_18112/g.29380  ORF Transcript_18112/g.29380 Transcript_18112/m.29380 type:complete len:209 (-) Transcript_18112:607-1233(-)
MSTNLMGTKAMLARVGRWSSIRQGSDRANLLVFSNRCPGRIVEKPCKIAAFDLDDTLIKTKSGRKSYMRVDGGDWVMANRNVKQRLKSLQEEGFELVLFSNQNTIKGAHSGVAATKLKRVVEGVVDELDLELSFLAATQKDAMRKGISIGMWDYYLNTLLGCEDAEIDYEESFFVGNAAGRERDHGMEDKEFARQVGLDFLTETSYFL